MPLSVCIGLLFFFFFNATKGLFGYLRVMLQVANYITVIEIAKIEITVTRITVFGLGFTNGN